MYNIFDTQRDMTKLDEVSERIYSLYGTDTKRIARACIEYTHAYHMGDLQE